MNQTKTFDAFVNYHQISHSSCLAADNNKQRFASNIGQPHVCTLAAATSRSVSGQRAAFAMHNASLQWDM
jgi:hypothetical protein